MRRVTTRRNRSGCRWAYPRNAFMLCKKRTTGGNLVVYPALAAQIQNCFTTPDGPHMAQIVAPAAIAANILRLATTYSCSTTKQRKDATNHCNNAPLMLAWVLSGFFAFCKGQRMFIQPISSRLSWSVSPHYTANQVGRYREYNEHLCRSNG